MKKIWFVGLALASVLVTAPVAMADTVNFTISGNIGDGYSISGGGTLTGALSSVLGDATYPSDPTAANNTYNITGAGFSISIDGVTPLTANGLGVIYSDPNNVSTFGYSYYGGIGSYYPWSRGVWYDNALTAFWGSSEPYLTDNGLLLMLSNGDVLNIFYDNYGDAYNGDYLWNEFNQSGTPLINNDEGGDPLNLDIFTPEPSSLILLGTGLFSLAGLLFWKAKPSMVRVR